MSHMIEVKNVSKVFGKEENETRVLNDASFSVERGEFVSLMGASGSGKSTMLYLIGGLDREFDGSIKVDGLEIQDMKEKELSKIRLDKIGFVFQSVTARKKLKKKLDNAIQAVEDKIIKERNNKSNKK